VEIAQIFYEIANLLEIKGNKFRSRAYRRAAQTIETLPESLLEINNRDALEKIHGVGINIAKKIQELLETGKLRYLKRLRRKIPKGLLSLMEIEGIGPKIAVILHKKLKIENIDELEVAVKQGKLREFKGFGEKTERNILQGIAIYRRGQERFLLGYALPIAVKVKEMLEKCPAVERVSLAGSIRRRKETIGDADILVTSGEPLKVMDYFVTLPQVRRVNARGETKSSVLLSNDFQVDLRVVGERSFGAALQYFTGSKEHNIRLRELALKKGWKLSEYHLQDKQSGRIVAGEDEESIYNALKLDYIEPELRENRGEVKAALEGELPRLVRYNEMRGDLHVHTAWSDGVNSIQEMATIAKREGLEYLAVCDHSETLRIAHGLSGDDLLRQLDEVHKVNGEIEEFTVLQGVEVNIKTDGRLDIEDQILKEMDIVVASIHSGFKQSKEQVTHRLLSAIHNEYVNVIGHPTGRLIHRRNPYQVDLAKVFEAASEQEVFMEINAFPNRLDLSGIHAQNAKESNVKLTIGSDAHSIDQLGFIELGVAVARRGWLRPKDVCNTLPIEALEKVLRR
jgi:DNA polymerase (family 10)